MALRALMARVRTSAPALRLQTPALGFSPLPGGRPNFHSAAAATRRLSPPAGGRPCLISTRFLVPPDPSSLIRAAGSILLF
ncbi:hypothetical protein CFC21_106449 [Triticum aestivum]|uniref:Uncharacterized protein n=2 Tax=Triticum aestivum TaxID=4565 RepID=A0A3B6TB85_WHEAT|nr:hypothetical protein CFC21_106449 [Triticum aestivum]